MDYFKGMQYVDGPVCSRAHAGRPLQNAPFCPIPASDSNFNPPPNFGGLILKILSVFLWLKFSPSLVLNKIEHFSKVSPGGKIFELEIKKRPLNWGFTKGLKVSAAPPLARWGMRSLFRLNGQAAKLVSAVAVHGHSGKTEVADYSWSG